MVMVIMVSPMVTNKPGLESVLPDSPPLASGAGARGLLRLRPNPLMDSTDTTPMLMVSTVPMESPLHTNKEAPKASVERGLLMKLPLLKLTKFSDPDITAMSDKLFGDSPEKPRGQLKPNLRPKPKLPP